MLTVTVVASRHSLSRPAVAVVLVAAAFTVTASATWLQRTDFTRLLAPPVVVAELVVGVSISLADGWAYRSGHAFSTAQSLGGAWPLAGVLTAGIAWGPSGGALSGLAIGLARGGGSFANGVSASHLNAVQIIALVTTAALYTIAGGVVGHVAVLLDRAERTVSAARARDEVARTLHDGVLQTLAIVERSAGDPALARLARDQERELRDFLSAAPETLVAGRAGRAMGSRRAPQGASAALAVELRKAAARYEAAFGGAVRVIVADDVPVLEEASVDALSRAAGEAMTNAGKHGHAAHVTVYVEPEGEAGVFCSVKDDGEGFSVAEVAEGFGITRSIRARIAEVGGTVEVDSAPASGTEVRMRIPGPKRVRRARGATRG
jgi:signal transduction histidine kinase